MKVDAPRVARRARAHFEKAFEVDVLPTDAGDSQVALKHRKTGLTEHGVFRLGCSDQDKECIVDEMFEALSERIVKAGGSLW